MIIEIDGHIIEVDGDGNSWKIGDDVEVLGVTAVISSNLSLRRLHDTFAGTQLVVRGSYPQNGQTIYLMD